MMDSVLLTVKGIPAPKGSKSKGRYGNLYESSKAVKPWMDAIRAEVLTQYRDELRKGVLITGPVRVVVNFCLRKPKTVKRVYPDVKPDLDKLERSTYDALTQSGVIGDDACIISSESSKAYGIHFFGAIISVIKVKA